MTNFTKPRTPVEYTLEEFPHNPKIHQKIWLMDSVTNYTIVTYDRNMVCDDEAETGKYRSVIFRQGNLVCFAPPKSITFEQFIKKYPQELDQKSTEIQIPEEIHITEIIEGTMINIFYDHNRNVWEMATKNAIGARYWYFSQHDSNNRKTFRDMFMEAIGEKDYTDLQDTQLVAELDRNCCYNFVLQHPDNHLVFEITTPRLYLVSAYHVYSTIKTVLYIPLVDLQTSSLVELVEKNIIHFPKTFTYPREYTALEQFVNYCESFSDIVGAMLTNINTGERTKIERKKYLKMKEIRGNDPNLLYKYLCLLRTRKITEFLSYFPIYKSAFDTYKTQFDQFVNDVHSVYFMRFIKKIRNEIQYSKSMAYFTGKIHHEVYVPSFNSEIGPTVITKPVVRNWLLDNYDPAVIMYHIGLEGGVCKI